MVGVARRGDRDYAAGQALRRMEALNARKMETDGNSSGVLGAGENGGGSHRLQLCCRRRSVRWGTFGGDLYLEERLHGGLQPHQLWIFVRRRPE